MDDPFASWGLEFHTHDLVLLNNKLMCGMFGLWFYPSIQAGSK